MRSIVRKELLNYQRLQELAFAVLLLAAASIPALTQCSGKAEPLRIEFKKGANSTTIIDKGGGSEEAEYVVAIAEGQRLFFKLTSTPRRSSCFDLRLDQADIGAEHDCNYDYSQTVPKTGDYLITVARPTIAAGTSSYKLTVTIS